MRQNTIKKAINFSGTGLHSGVEVNIQIKPAAVDTGIIFKRVDIEKDNKIPALYSNVVNTQLGTTIANAEGAVVQTIEHFMAALWACGIDNIIIDIDNKEVPIMDGSADIFIKEIKRAGIEEQDAERKILKLTKEIEVESNGSVLKITPHKNFNVDISVEYSYGEIGSQSFMFDGSLGKFSSEIAKCRTFCNEKEIEFMKKNGLALGGSLDNAMVFNNEGLINESGFRCDCEVVKHKLLDCVGDLYTSGHYIHGLITANKPGHTINNELLKEIFSNPNNYIIE